MTDFNREALPHDISGYEKQSHSMSMTDFERACPFPFLLYARSRLWDPTLVASRQGLASGGEETRMVNYNIATGGMTFLSPIKKIQSEPRLAGVLMGRGTIGNDMVVPVSSVSTKHARFMPPGASANNSWNIVDLDSRNGTFLAEEQIKAQNPTLLDDGCYLRLGGNLIAWFLYPGRLWQLLRDKDELQRLTDL